VARRGGYAGAVDEALARRLRAAGILDARVIHSMAKLDRARFVPEPWRSEAGDDRPLPIGHGQTISQPTLVAAMTELLELAGTERVLEVGTGSGYQTAILAALAGEVWSVERVPELAEAARARLLVELGLANLHLRTGDGALGWAEAAPFDRILVTAGAEAVPPPLLEQLAAGGRMVVPVGPPGGVQWLRALDLDAAGRWRARDLAAVRFVPLD